MLTMPRCRGRLSRRAPLAAPLPLEPLPAGEPPLDASAAAPCVLLPLLLPPFAAWPSASCAAPASASSSAFTAAAVGEGWLREGGMRPKVCWIKSLVCCRAEGLMQRYAGEWTPVQRFNDAL